MDKVNTREETEKKRARKGKKENNEKERRGRKNETKRIKKLFPSEGPTGDLI